MSRQGQMTSRVPCAPETYDMLNEIKEGGGFTYDALLRLLVDVVRQENESDTQLGYRLKGIAIQQESSDSTD